MPSRTRMAAIAVAARAREAMVQLALFPTECKPRRASILFSIKMGASRGIRRPSAFHSEACGKLVPQSARGAMHVRILLQITGNDGTPGLAEEIAALEKRVERPEDLGLSLAEGKALTAASSVVWCRPRSGRGRSAIDAAIPAVSAGVARAATRSCSEPSTVM